MEHYVTSPLKKKIVWDFSGGAGLRSLSANAREAKTLVQPLGPQDPREEETVCSPVLGWRIPRTEESLVRYRIRGREESDRTLYPTDGHCILPEVKLWNFRRHISRRMDSACRQHAFQCKLWLGVIATPFDYSSFSSTCDNKVPQKKKFTVFSVWPLLSFISFHDYS